MKKIYSTFKMLLLLLLAVITQTTYSQTITDGNGFVFEVYTSNNYATIIGYNGTQTNSLILPTHVTYNDNEYIVKTINWAEENNTITTLDMSNFNEECRYNDGYEEIHNIAQHVFNRNSDLSNLKALKEIFVDYRSYYNYKTSYNSNMSKYKSTFAEQADVKFNMHYQVYERDNYGLRYIITKDTTYNNLYEMNIRDVARIVGFETISNNTEEIPTTINGYQVISVNTLFDDDASADTYKLYFYGPMLDNVERGIDFYEFIDKLPNLENIEFYQYYDYTYYYPTINNINENIYVHTQGNFNEDQTIIYQSTYTPEYDESTGLMKVKEYSYLLKEIYDKTITTLTLPKKNASRNVSGIIDSDTYNNIKTLIVEGDYTQYFPTNFTEEPWEGISGFKNVETLYCNINSYEYFKNNGAQLVGNGFNGFQDIRVDVDDVIYRVYYSEMYDLTVASVVEYNGQSNKLVIPNCIEVTREVTDTEIHYIHVIGVEPEKTFNTVTELKLEMNPYGAITADGYKHYTWGAVYKNIPNLTSIKCVAYQVIEELKTLKDDETSPLYNFSDNLSITYDGTYTDKNSLKLATYDGSKFDVWLGFSDTAEGYVTASNRDADGSDIFSYIGIIEPNENVTHLAVDINDFSGTAEKGAFAQLTNLKGLYLSDNPSEALAFTAFLPDGPNIFLGPGLIEALEKYPDYYSYQTSGLLETDDEYDGLSISGSLFEGFDIIGYNGTATELDLTNGTINYHDWDVPINSIISLSNTQGNTASTLTLVDLPCNVYVNSNSFYNLTGTAPATHFVQEDPTLALALSCTTVGEELFFNANNQNALKNLALVFVDKNLLNTYKTNFPDYANRFVDIALIKSEEEGVAYDTETQTLEVSLSSETNLLQITNIINSGADVVENVLIKLTDDIDLTAEANPQQWSTLGTAEAPFNGTFDGQGYTLTIGTAEQQTEASTLFGNVGKNGKVENLNIEGVNYEADNNGGKEMIGDGEDESKKYFALLAETNDGVLSNIVVTGSVQAEEDIEGNIVACIVADNQGEMDHVVGYFEGLDETADGNKRCILVSQNVGVGRNAGKASKICSNTKQQANKRLTLGDNIDKQPLDVNDDIRYYNNTEMASGEPAYWLNFYGKGYSGEYTREWSKGTKYPIVADANHKPAVKLIYAIEGATATEVGLKNMVYYANEGDQITLETTQAPGEVIVNGSKQNNISKKMTITLNGQAATDGTITITLKYGTTPVPIIETNNTINISATNRQITIRNAANQPFSIYNIKGQEVLHGIVNSNLQQLLIPEIGVYIVKVADTTKKVVIR